MAEITRRGFLKGMLAALGSQFLPRTAFAEVRGLIIKYSRYKNQHALRVPIRRGESYASIAKIYTGHERHTPELQAFNRNKRLYPATERELRGGRTLSEDHVLYIPYSLLRKALADVLAENKFVTYEIEGQGDAQGITTLWQLAEDYISSNLNVLERIEILLAINSDINPFSRTVYPSQKILVPQPWIKTSLVISKEEASKEVPQAREKKTTRQNPFKTSLAFLRRNLQPKDRYGAQRLRYSGGGYYASRHTGIDLAAPIGTKLYPIEEGVVQRAGKDRALWRNGIIVEYNTNSGLVVTYIHMSKVYVRPGQRITTDTVLGLVGVTGNASQSYPHVHIQVKINGNVVDPTQYILIDS